MVFFRVGFMNFEYIIVNDKVFAVYYKLGKAGKG
jgi:hypothetical protein